MSVVNSHNRPLSKYGVPGLLVIGILSFVIIASQIETDNRRIMGDESSHILQSMSIAFDADLRYDDHDQQHWLQLGWEDSPRGLFFQKYQSGWAFAKPYGYSLFLAFFVVLFGKAGYAIGNSLLLAMVAGISFWALVQAYSKLEAMLLTISIVFFSYLYFYAFYLHPDLFLACMVALFSLFTIKQLQSPCAKWMVLLGIVAAVLLAEKIVTLVLIAPVVLYVLVRSKSHWERIGFFLPATVMLAVLVLPYLHYSDFQAWNPYSGERYQNRLGELPISIETQADLQSTMVDNGDSYTLQRSTYIRRADTRRYFSFDYIFNTLSSLQSLKTIGQNVVYYFFGAFTGVVVFIPIAMFVFLLALGRIWPGKNMLVLSVLAGIAFYIGFYLVFFPTNYYGAGQSLGNRYFLQVCTIILVLLVAMKLNRAKVVALTVLSAAFSVVFLYHHHISPAHAYKRIFSASKIQRLMPAELTQAYLNKSHLSRIPINTNLYPSLEKRRKVSRVVNVGGRNLAIVEKPFSIYGTPLKSMEIDGSTIYVDGGVQLENGGTVVMSRLSNIVFDRETAPHLVTVQSGGNVNIVEVTIGNRSLKGDVPFSFQLLERYFGKDRYKHVRFSASRQGVSDNQQTIDFSAPMNIKITFDKPENTKVLGSKPSEWKPSPYAYVNDREIDALYRETRLSNGEPIVSNGFYIHRGTLSWSPQASSILVNPLNSVTRFRIESPIPGNQVNVSIGNRSRTASTPFLLDVTAEASRGDWLEVFFQSEKEGPACKLIETNSCRNIGFKVDGMGELEIEDHDILPVVTFDN